MPVKAPCPSTDMAERRNLHSEESFLWSECAVVILTALISAHRSMLPIVALPWLLPPQAAGVFLRTLSLQCYVLNSSHFNPHCLNSEFCSFSSRLIAASQLLPNLLSTLSLCGVSGSFGLDPLLWLCDLFQWFPITYTTTSIPPKKLLGSCLDTPAASVSSFRQFPLYSQPI